MWFAVSIQNYTFVCATCSLSWTLLRIQLLNVDYLELQWTGIILKYWCYQCYQDIWHLRYPTSFFTVTPPPRWCLSRLAVQSALPLRKDHTQMKNNLYRWTEFIGDPQVSSCTEYKKSIWAGCRQLYLSPFAYRIDSSVGVVTCSGASGRKAVLQDCYLHLRHRSTAAGTAAACRLNERLLWCHRRWSYNLW